MLRSIAAALVLTLVAASALAQEYGRTDVGDLQLATKSSTPISGSFSLSHGTLGSKMFNAAAGGTLVADRLWFFASAAKTDSVLTNRFGSLALPAQTAGHNVDAKAMAQLGSRQSLFASFAADRTVATDSVLSSANLSTKDFAMHYTGIVSPNAFFSVSVSQRHANIAQQ